MADFSPVASLGRLGRVTISACAHQEQEQRALALIFSLGAAVFPSGHNGFAGKILNPPPPSGSAPFRKHHFEHPPIDRISDEKIPETNGPKLSGDPSRSNTSNEIKRLFRQTDLTASVEPNELFSVLANQEAALGALLRATPLKTRAVR
jgi:hypothetical protein